MLARDQKRQQAGAPQTLRDVQGQPNSRQRMECARLLALWLLSEQVSQTEKATTRTTAPKCITKEQV